MKIGGTQQQSTGNGEFCLPLLELDHFFLVLVVVVVVVVIEIGIYIYSKEKDSLNLGFQNDFVCYFSLGWLIQPPLISPIEGDISNHHQISRLFKGHTPTWPASPRLVTVAFCLRLSSPRGAYLHKYIAMKLVQYFLVISYNTHHQNLYNIWWRDNISHLLVFLHI